MANIHFGEIGDVWKHLPLGEVLAIERPRRMWETHAGSATYPLTRSWEREYGVYRFMTCSARHPVLASSRYAQILRSDLSPIGELETYPGSPMLAMRILGQDATYLFCDLDAASVANVSAGAREAGLADLVRVERADGLATVWHAAQELPPEAAPSTLVHLDPYDERLRSADGMDALDLFARLAAGSFPVVLWYGYETEPQRDELLGRVTAPAGGSGWAADIATPRVTGETSLDPGVPGCGIVTANLSERCRARIEELGESLAAAYADALMPDGTPGHLRFTALPLR